MNYLVTIIILAVVIGWCARAERKRMEREAAREARAAARRDWDRLDALILATREKPHESYAFGPDADQPVPYLPVEVGDFAEWEGEYARYCARQLRRRQEGSEL